MASLCQTINISVLLRVDETVKIVCQRFVLFYCLFLAVFTRCVSNNTKKTSLVAAADEHWSRINEHRIFIVCSRQLVTLNGFNSKSRSFCIGAHIYFTIEKDMGKKNIALVVYRFTEVKQMDRWMARRHTHSNIGISTASVVCLFVVFFSRSFTIVFFVGCIVVYWIGICEKEY